LGNFLIEGFILKKALAPFIPPTDQDGKKQKRNKCNFLSLLAGGREGKPKKNTHTHTHTSLPLTRREIMYCKTLTS
jgi:hypothetical protein